MKRTRAILLYTTVVVVTCAVATIASLPASIGAALVAKSTDGRVTLQRPAGSIWEGRADINIMVPGGPLVLRDVDWAVRGWRLLLGEVAADVRIGGPEPKGKGLVVAGLGGLHVREAEASVPARFIADRAQWLRAWEVGGTIEVKGDDVEIIENGIVGDAQVLWRNASSSKVSRLGDYRLDVSGDRQATRFKLATLSGALQLTGSATVEPTGAFRMQGSAVAEPASRERLAPLLVLLGPPRPDGSVAFEWPLGGGAAAPAGGPAHNAPRKTGAAVEASIIGLAPLRKGMRHVAATETSRHG